MTMEITYLLLTVGAILKIDSVWRIGTEKSENSDHRRDTMGVGSGHSRPRSLDSGIVSEKQEL